MEHSTAILEDAGNKIDTIAAKPEASSSDKPNDTPNGKERDGENSRKRKGNWQDKSLQHGSRGGGGRNDNKRHKKGDLGRGEYLCV